MRSHESTPRSTPNFLQGAMMERQFTDAYIRSLKPRSSRYEEFRDGGFGIRVPPQRTKNISIPL